jgi:hypothetical protein
LKDDYWLAFDPWLEYEAATDQKKLPQKEQIEMWRRDDDVALEETKRRFLQNGWKLCPLAEIGPERSSPSLEY